MWIIILLTITVLSIFLVVTIKKISILNRSSTTTANIPDFNISDSFSLCFNEDFILHLQRDQWTKAKVEVFGSNQAGFHGSDMEFYKKSFGLVDITLPRNSRYRSKKQHSNLIYYRIYKNANDYIRNILTEYVYFEDNQSREFSSQNCYALDEHCVHRFVHYFSPSAIKSLYVKQPDSRFSFTFIREPIDRFISAMTEIEYRSKQAADLYGLQTELPFQHPLGSQFRFQEFIKMILSTGGSRALFRNLAKFEVIHVVPMIPTLILAEKVEGKPLRTFRVEEFDSEWGKVSKVVGIPILNSLHQNRTINQRLIHPSSKDLYNTTLAAKSLLSYASIDSFKRFGEKLTNRQKIPVGYNQQEYQLQSKTYLKSLCRIYLIDYICLNYTLPADCQELQGELREVVDDYWQYHAKSNVVYIETLSDVLRLFLPKSIMELLSVAACLFSPTPECESRFTHGTTVLEVTDRHEEL